MLSLLVSVFSVLFLGMILKEMVLFWGNFVIVYVVFVGFDVGIGIFFFVIEF